MTTKAAEAHYIKSVADYIAMSAIKNSYARDQWTIRA